MDLFKQWAEISYLNHSQSFIVFLEILSNCDTFRKNLLHFLSCSSELLQMTTDSLLWTVTVSFHIKKEECGKKKETYVCAPMCACVSVTNVLESSSRMLTKRQVCVAGASVSLRGFCPFSGRGDELRQDVRAGNVRPLPKRCSAHHWQAHTHLHTHAVNLQE